MKQFANIEELKTAFEADYVGDNFKVGEKPYSIVEYGSNHSWGVVKRGTPDLAFFNEVGGDGQISVEYMCHTIEKGEMVQAYKFLNLKQSGERVN
jgi:hypothetical protein